MGEEEKKRRLSRKYHHSMGPLSSFAIMSKKILKWLKPFNITFQSLTTIFIGFIIFCVIVLTFKQHSTKFSVIFLGASVHTCNKNY